MPTQTQSITALHALLDQRDRLSDAIGKLQERALRIRNEIRSRQMDLIAVENAIREVQVASNTIAHPSLGPPTSRNLGVIRAWTAVAAELDKETARNGLTVQAIQHIIIRSVPGISSSTVRSHLHRFKKRGLLRQHGSRILKGPEYAPSSTQSGGERGR